LEAAAKMRGQLFCEGVPLTPELDVELDEQVETPDGETKV